MRKPPLSCPALLTVALLLFIGACSDPEVRKGGQGEVRIGRAFLSRAPKNPMALGVSTAGDVYWAERTGEVRRYDAKTGLVKDALVLAVDTGHESGLLGLALDPSFAENGYVYLYYSLPLEEPLPLDAPPGKNVLARFTASKDGALDPASRVELLVVPSERLCCHEGGGLAFAPDGTLFLSVGDNTNPFGSSGAAPLDGRAGHETYDARRTAPNPFDLRGKILRIAPDGGIPPGNLFPESGELGRPEIYTLGNRNPFRLAVDPRNGALYWGEIGPDALEDSSLGPRGYDEIDRATAPGNFGWPYCIADGLAYSDFDFTTSVVGAPFDCAGTEPSLLAYDYDTVSYDALGDGYDDTGMLVGRAAMAGAVYRSSEDAPNALPARFQGALLMTDWTRDVIAAVTFDGDGALTGVERPFPGEAFHRPIDIEVTPDGAVYVLEYGSAFWGDNPDAAISRLEFGTALSPVATLGASPTFGASPLTVELSAAGSHVNGDGETLVEYLWDLDGDGAADATGERVSHVFEEPGNYGVGLVVVSSSGKRSLPVGETIVVGNAPPEVHIVSPDPGVVLVPGGGTLLEGWGHDPEDGDAACDELVWNIGLGHNAHTHPVTSLTGCSVTFVPDLGDHGDTDRSERLFYGIELVYTDHGGPHGEAPLTARQGITVDVAH